MTKRLLLAIAALVIPTLAYAGLLLGPLSSGSTQVPPVTGTAPVVGSLTCDIALPIVNQNVVLTGGGTCGYTATCNAASCTGMDAITSWAITAQSAANAFALSSTGTLKGGSASGSVTTGAYTVTVTATNATGTSPGVVQTVNAFAAPVVAATACTIKSPVTNNINVVLQAGGDCQYTATCSGGACSGANAITAWTIASQTCTGCYQVSATGALQGGANAANVGNTTATVNLTATNAGGTSPIVAETVTAITVPVVSNKNFSVTLPFVPPTGGQTIGTMTATPNSTSWAITAVSGNGAGPADFAISNGGVITTTASAATDITTAGSVAITVTAANATGTSAPATATLAVATNPPPLVQSKTCNVNPPVTNGVAVSPACTFTATCGGGACIAPYAITGWTIVSQTHASGFTITSGGVLQGGTNGATTIGANTVTVTATNSVATSPAVGETVNVAGTPPVVSNGSYSQTLPLTAGNLSPAMTATCGGIACSGVNAITSWAVTGASGDNAQLRDFSISSGGVLALTSFAPTDITTAGTVTINVSATNVAGTGTGTATLTVNAATAATCGAATGGSISVVGSNRIHTFTSSGTFTTSVSCTISYLIVGGGGGGGNGINGGTFFVGGGGGGCGGVLSGSQAVGPGAFTVTIGSGGAIGGSGGSSVLSGVATGNGGGAGGSGQSGNGSAGGCGGGGSGGSVAAGNGGVGSQGGGGGAGTIAILGVGGGGGGKGSNGVNGGQNGISGSGGTGFASAITGTNQTYSCGGGGGGTTGGAAGCAGAGAGGLGGPGITPTPGNGASFYGSGGGGGFASIGGAGFQGIVVISYSNNTLPAGVTLRAIDGETMTGLVQSHSYYTTYSHAHSMGWDNPSYFPIGPFLTDDYSSAASAYAGKTVAQVYTDVGWNIIVPPSSENLALALANGVSLVGPDGGAGGGTVGGAMPLPWVGIYMQDEPTVFPDSRQYTTITTPITGTANSIQDSLFFFWVNTWEWNAGHGLIGAPAPNTPTSIMAGVLTTPNGSHRHRDMTTVDMYWFSEAQWGFMTGCSPGDQPPGGAGTQIYNIPCPGGGMTDAQARRGTNYGDMVDIQRSYQGTFPAPITSIIEDGNPFNATNMANWITPLQYNQVLWASIIHGARAFCIFDHNFNDNISHDANVLATNPSNGMSIIRAGQTISMYDQMKATQNLIHNMAPIVNAPFALGYAAASPAGYVFPTPLIHIQNGIDMATHWYQDGTFTNASGTFNNGFYVFATPSNATTDTNISATFTVKSGSTATVVGESRTIPIVAGSFSDTFAKATTVHIYQIN